MKRTVMFGALMLESGLIPEVFEVLPETAEHVIAKRKKRWGEGGSSVVWAGTFTVDFDTEAVGVPEAVLKKTVA